MKKIVSLLIVCVLALGCLPAFGEDAYLTAEEIQDYCDSLLQTARTLPPVSPEETEAGAGVSISGPSPSIPRIRP